MAWHTFKIDIEKHERGYTAFVFPRHKTTNCCPLTISFHELYDEGYDDKNILFKDFYLIYNGTLVGTIPYNAKYNIDVKTISCGNFYREYVGIPM